MTVTITHANIDRYISGCDLDVLEVYWKAGPLIHAVLVSFPNAQVLHCANNGLTTLEGLSACINLQHLYCQNNKLESLEGIDACTLLRRIDCSDNVLRSLHGLEVCTELKTLDCQRNRLTSITEIRFCTQLYELDCNSNRILSLSGIEMCINMQELYCSINRLTTIRGIEVCSRLHTLEVQSNNIDSLDPLVYLPHMHTLDTWNNPLGVQTTRIQRYLRRLRTTSYKSSIYADSQNVHNETVQRSVCDSIQNLLTDPKPRFSIEHIIESGLDEKTVSLLVEYCTSEAIHSLHQITYSELLGYVWARIQRSEHKDELFKILAEQIGDSECKCFTGRFNLTLSVLVGFYSDIVIEISDNSRIGAIILAVKARIEPYNPVVHRQAAMHELIEAGYTEAEIESWLGAITEP